MQAFCTDVVVALIWRHGRLLVGLRPEGKSFALLWEFPGGKCEAGETHSQALVRECAEELGVGIEVGPLTRGPVVTGDHHGALRLFFYHARLQQHDARPQALTTLEIAWVEPAQLLQLPFCPADGDLVVALAAGKVGPPPGF